MKVPYITMSKEQIKIIIQIEFIKKKIFYDDSYIEMKPEILLNKLINTKSDEIWEVFNFFLIATKLWDSFDWKCYNPIETLFLKDVNEDLIKWYKIKRFQLLVENIINEMITKDIDIQTFNTPWVSIKLDNLYNTDLLLDQTHICSKILPRTKDLDLRKKIINNNLVISSLDSFNNITFFNKILFKKISKKCTILPEITEKIHFTKGYVLLFDPKTVDILKKLIYRRKIIKFTKTHIRPINVEKVKDSLNNSNYSEPIWMKEVNITKIKNINENYIKMNILEDIINPEIFTESLNYLNNIEIVQDSETFNLIYKMAENKKLLTSLIITKNVLKDSIYVLGSEAHSEIDIDIDDEENHSLLLKSSDSLVQSAAFIELVKIQYSRFNSFFFEHRYDSRTRIYNYNYPINYQLSHLVRLTIKFKNNYDQQDYLIKTIKNLYNLDILSELGINLSKLKIFHYQKLINIKLYIELLKSHGFDTKVEDSEEIYTCIAKNMKLESILLVLEKIAPKQIINLELKITYVLSKLKEFMEADLNNKLDLEKIMSYFKFKNKKLIYFLQYQVMLKNMIKGDYSNLIWVDASSNGIQLITLRIGNLNRDLLQITNIIENKTQYADVYSYVTQNIKNMDHSSFLKKITNKITNTELILLQNESDNKDRIMPASYGKGNMTSRKDMNEKYINKNNIAIWNKLTKDDQNKVSDYIWDLNLHFLENIGFFLESYKKICKDLENDNDGIFCWYNDSQLPINPINIYKTKRQKILKDLEILKMKLKDVIDEKMKEKIEKKIEKKKKKLASDEKTYYKRTLIKTKRMRVKIRIPFTETKINRRETNQAIMPNAIHSYDASNIVETLKIMKQLEIQGLCIFDSIGSQTVTAPLIKIIFKIANIKNIESGVQKEKFPFKKNTIGLETVERTKLYLEILESTFLIK